MVNLVWGVGTPKDTHRDRCLPNCSPAERRGRNSVEFTRSHSTIITSTTSATSTHYHHTHQSHPTHYYQHTNTTPIRITQATLPSPHPHHQTKSTIRFLRNKIQQGHVNFRLWADNQGSSPSVRRHWTHYFGVPDSSQEHYGHPSLACGGGGGSNSTETSSWCLHHPLVDSASLQHSPSAWDTRPESSILFL